MGLFNFFRRKKVEAKTTEPPSQEHLEFAKRARGILGEALEQFGFELHHEEVKKDFTILTYRHAKRYIKVSATTHWHDHPSHYNIIMGTGDSEDAFEYRWNSIALWRLKTELAPTTEAASYPFPFDEKIETSLLHAKEDLLQYGDSFLNNDLTLFHKIRKEQNEKSEPIKILTPDKNGKYKATNEPKSAKQKKRFS